MCKFEGAAPPKGWSMGFQKSWFGLAQTHMYNFVVSGPKLTWFFSPNAGRIAVITSFRFWMSLSVLEIFAIKVWSPKTAPKPNFACVWPQFLGENQKLFGPRLQKAANFQSCGKVSWWSAKGAGRSSTEINKKHQQQRPPKTTITGGLIMCHGYSTYTWSLLMEAIISQMLSYCVFDKQTVMTIKQVWMQLVNISKLVTIRIFLNSQLYKN